MSTHFFGLNPDEFTNQFLAQIIIGLIVTGIIMMLGLLFNKKIRKYLKLSILWLKDDKISLHAFYTKKYDIEPTRTFDNQIFKQLVDEIKSDKITKVAVNPKFIRLYSDNLGMKINVDLEEESDLETAVTEEPRIASYNVTINMDAEIQGIRQLDRIEDFTNLAENVHNIIRNRCFPDMDIRQSFVVCDVNKIEKNRHDSIHDDQLESEITFSEKTIKIKTSSPQSLRKTVKKYVYA